MNRYWLSWWQGGDDYRPINYPPNEAILGWWCSGERYRGEESEFSMCAAVDAESTHAAWAAIRIDWPDMGEHRFCNVKPANFETGDRFPLSDWMLPRFARSV